jgi:quercetin dioxygenase-like cupin family protein
MNTKYFIGNAILWAAAILASALVHAPVVLSSIILPTLTYTAPGDAPPMHTHKGEESHVLLKGQKVLYALGDKLFVKEGPYIVNIPPGVPHSFQNLDDEVAELVVIFPSNVWEYDVLDYFPFSTPEAKAMAEEARRATAQSRRK